VRTQTRPALSRERVLEAAIRLADDDIDALSMRRLADELGVEAMSLYHYVRSKDEILAGIMDRVVAEIPQPARGRDWKAAIRASAVAFHDALRKHPWATSLLMSPKHMSVARLHYMDALLACLREAGLSPLQTHHAYHALDSHIIGSTLWEGGYRQWAKKVDIDAVAKQVIEIVPRDRHPYFHEHLQQHLTGATRGEKSEFEFGLDLILDGVERMLPKRRAGVRSARA
jgi:AcrR family transcriptional regulator